MTGGFKHLSHTADVLIEAWGDSIEEAFEYAALGVFEVMTNTSLVKPEEEKRIEVEGGDLESLLYNWIEKLLILFDTEQILFSKFKVEKIEKKEEIFKLYGIAAGEQYSGEKHESRTLVKAVTYHLMEISSKNSKVVVRFVVDI
ncbi:MAG: archease [Thermofilaceae archaeon]